MSLLITLSRILAKYTALFVIGTAVFAYFVPSSCTFVKGNTQIIILGIIMLSMGMTLGRQDYRILAQRPFDILIGTIGYLSDKLFGMIIKVVLKGVGENGWQ